MESLSPEQINSLVSEVLAKLGRSEGSGSIELNHSQNDKLGGSSGWKPSNSGAGNSSRGVFTSIDRCVEAASTAFQEWSRLKLEHKKSIIDKLRVKLRTQIQWMAEEAVAEENR